MKIYKRLSVLLIAMLSLCLLLPAQAHASEHADDAREISLCISCQDGKTSLSGVRFNLYLVATAGKDGALTRTAEYAGYPVSLEEGSGGVWRTAALALAGYTLRDGISPIDSAQTDANGWVLFPSEGKSLKPGLYLVLGERHIQNGKRYDAAPILITLPAREQAGNGFVYDARVAAKFDVSDTPDSATTERRVLKVWEDKGHEKQRPKEVIVQLLCDGMVYDTVSLNEANNWRHTWTQLLERHTWTVVEKEMKNYTVEVTREGTAFVVTNTIDANAPVDTPPGPEKLPQTGQLWWPVPVLITVGLVFIIAGVLRRREMSDEN